MAITQIQQKPKSSGGLFGKILGGLAQVAGVAAAPLTGGASIPLAGAVEKLSGAIDPTKIRNDNNVSPVNTPLASMENTPGVQISRLNDFENAVKANPNIPNDEAMNYLDKSKIAKQSILDRYGRA